MSQSLNIHFLQTQQALSQKMKKMLKITIEKYAEDACQVLDISLINIIIWPNQNAVIPQTGEGGETLSQEVCFVYIDPTKSEDKLENIITAQIPGTVYHELNHIARWDALGKSVGFHTNLSQSIISEGLASVFQTEKWNKAKSPWTIYTQEEIIQLLHIYQNRNKTLDTNYNHEEWFYGEGNMPRWTGYKIGFYIISALRKKYPNMEWKDLVRMDSQKIIELADIIN